MSVEAMLISMLNSASPTAPWQQRRETLQRSHAARALLPRVATVPKGSLDRMGSAQADTAPLPLEVIISSLPENYLSTDSLPLAWDWRSVVVATDAPPIHFTTRVRNQFLPYWCGSCWAHAAAAVLGSRWLIHTNATATPNVDFSVQYFVNCVNGTNPGGGPTRGCHGGSAYEAFAHTHKYGAVDSSCLPYSAVTQTCTANNTCQQHLNSHQSVMTIDHPIRYHVGEFGLVGAWGTGTPPAEREVQHFIVSCPPHAAIHDI